MINNQRFYSLIFPVWVLFLFPGAWFALLPLNLLIDGCLLFVTLRLAGVERIRQTFLKNLLKVWIFGLVSSCVGFMCEMIPFAFRGSERAAEISFALSQNPFSDVYAVLLSILAIIVSAAVCFVLNFKLTFPKSDYEKKARLFSSLAFSVITAPYTLLIPTILFK